MGRDLASMVPRREVACRRTPAKSFYPRPRVVAAGADDRDIEDRDLDLAVGSADLVAVAAQDFGFVADRLEVGADVAGVAPSGGDAQRTTLAPAPDDQRQPTDGPSDSTWSRAA